MTAGEMLQTLAAALRADRKGWLICGAVLLVTVVRSGLTYSFGVFVVQLEASYHSSMAEQNWIGTLSFCISLSCSPLSVAIIRSFGHRGYRIGGIVGTLILSTSCLSSSFVPSLEWMFFTHSLLYGIGSSLVYMASSLVIGEYFDKDHKYHVLATSLLLCGYPLGSLLFNPINAWLISRFEWRYAFRVMSGVIFVTGIVCCSLFSAKDTQNMQRLREEDDDEDDNDYGKTDDELKTKNKNQENQERRSSRTNAEKNQAKETRHCCTIVEIRARPEIVLWYLGNCLSCLGFYMPFVNLPYYMQLKAVPTTSGSLAVTILSLAECITYIVASLFGDYLKGSLVYVNAIAASALSVICVTWPFIDVNYAVILAISAAMGGFLGLTIVYTYAASGEVTEQPIDVAWSLTNLYSGIGILIGPVFTGAIYDIHHTYNDVFFVLGFVYIVDAAIFMAIPFVKHRRHLRQKTAYDDCADATKFSTFSVNCRKVASNSSLGETSASEYGTVSSNTGLVGAATSSDHVTKPPFCNSAAWHDGKSPKN